MSPVNLQKTTLCLAWLSETILLHGDQKDLGFGQGQEEDFEKDKQLDQMLSERNIR